jgi:hypothetical protein
MLMKNIRFKGTQINQGRFLLRFGKALEVKIVAGSPQLLTNITSFYG